MHAINFLSWCNFKRHNATILGFTSEIPGHFHIRVEVINHCMSPYWPIIQDNKCNWNRLTYILKTLVLWHFNKMISFRGGCYLFFKTECDWKKSPLLSLQIQQWFSCRWEGLIIFRWNKWSHLQSIGLQSDQKWLVLTILINILSSCAKILLMVGS